MAVRMHSDPFQHGKMPLHEKLQILIDHLLGRGPSEEEMELKKDYIKKYLIPDIHLKKEAGV